MFMNLPQPHLIHSKRVYLVWFAGNNVTYDRIVNMQTHITKTLNTHVNSMFKVHMLSQEEEHFTW